MLQYCDKLSKSKYSPIEKEFAINMKIDQRPSQSKQRKITYWQNIPINIADVYA